jgi:hypothetical protein
MKRRLARRLWLNALDERKSEKTRLRQIVRPQERRAQFVSSGFPDPSNVFKAEYFKTKRRLFGVRAEVRPRLLSDVRQDGVLPIALVQSSKYLVVMKEALSGKILQERMRICRLITKQALPLLMHSPRRRLALR